MDYGHYGYPVIWPSEWEALTPVQKGALMRRLVRRAHRARTRAIGNVLLGWTRYWRRRRVLRDLVELSAMDDMMLKDTGANRYQIHRAIRSGSDLTPSR